MVELDHPFTSSKPVDETWAAILDLDRLIPCVEGGSVTERTGPESAKAQIKVKMGAMSPMPAEWMNRKVRVKCERCRAVNVAVEEAGVDYTKGFGHRPR